MKFCTPFERGDSTDSVVQSIHHFSIIKFNVSMQFSFGRVILN